MVEAAADARSREISLPHAADRTEELRPARAPHLILDGAMGTTIRVQALGERFPAALRLVGGAS